MSVCSSKLQDASIQMLNIYRLQSDENRKTAHLLSGWGGGGWLLVFSPQVLILKYFQGNLRQDFSYKEDKVSNKYPK